MKKIILTVLVGLVTLPAWPAEENMLNFYQRQAVTQGRNAKQDRAFAAALAHDVEQWIDSHAQSPAVKTALLMQAEYYWRAEEDARALLALYQVRFYFPSQQDVPLLSSQVEKMMDRLDRNQKAQALKLLATETEAIQTSRDRQAALLEAFVKGELEHLYLPVCELFEDFFTQYPQDKQLDKMILQYGDWHRQNKNYLAAILEYQKIYDLFPNSVYRAASLRMIADVYAMDLKEYETADSLYKQVLEKYPGSAEQGIVYKHLAVLQENQKNYAAAISYYDKAIAELASQPAAYEAWTGKSEVLLKLKQPRPAYDALITGAALYQADEKKYVAALTEAASIARKQLRDPALQTTALEQILLAYPQTQKAPQLMYEVAESYAQQGKTAQAIDWYQKLVIHYPTDKYAGRAQSRLNKLQK